MAIEWRPTFGQMIRAARLRCYPARRHGVWVRVAPDAYGTDRHRLETWPPGLVKDRGHRDPITTFVLLSGSDEADGLLYLIPGFRTDHSRPRTYMLASDGSLVAEDTP